MATVRATHTVALSHPDHGGLIVVKRGTDYPSDHALVKTYGWAFEQDNVEQATAAPGERRKVTRKKSA